MSETLKAASVARTLDEQTRCLYAELVELSAKLASLVKKDNLMVNCDPGPVKSAFLSLSNEAQEAYVDRFRFFVEIVAGAQASGPTEQQMTWQALKYLKVRPPSDMFMHMQNDDYIEIYDRDGIQVFRNFGFCKLISYSLHELLIFPWTSLYERDEKVTSQILGAITKIWDANLTLINLDVEPHVAREKTLNKKKMSYRIEMKYFAPLFDENKEALFFLAGSKITPVESEG